MGTQLAHCQLNRSLTTAPPTLRHSGACCAVYVALCVVSPIPHAFPVACSRLVFYITLARDSSYYIYRFVLSVLGSVVLLMYHFMNTCMLRCLVDMILLMLMGIALVFLRANEPDRESQFSQTRASNAYQCVNCHLL